MCPEPKNISNHFSYQHVTYQQGSAVMMAVFILLFFSAMGVALVKMLSVSSDAVVLEVYSARAFHAANSGAEKKLADIFPVTGSGSCISENNLTFTGEGLQNCEADISCTEITESGITIYRVESTGNCSFDDSSRNTSRTVRVEARDIE